VTAKARSGRTAPAGLRWFGRESFVYAEPGPKSIVERLMHRLLSVAAAVAGAEAVLVLLWLRPSPAHAFHARERARAGL
jgi:hypothetical protein